MVDETAFREVLDSANPRPCPFGKAILACCCACSLARKHYIAERETVACASAPKREACAALHDALRQNSTFALRLVHADTTITHAQEMKVQCGGLLGLQLAVDDAREVADVAELVDNARRRFGGLEDLPYSQIVQSISSFRVRKLRDRE